MARAAVLKGLITNDLHICYECPNGKINTFWPAVARFWPGKAHKWPGLIFTYNEDACYRHKTFLSNDHPGVITGKLRLKLNVAFAIADGFKTRRYAVFLAMLPDNLCTL